MTEFTAAAAGYLEKEAVFGFLEQAGEKVGTLIALAYLISPPVVGGLAGAAYAKAVSPNKDDFDRVQSEIIKRRLRRRRAEVDRFDKMEENNAESNKREQRELHI